MLKYSVVFFCLLCFSCVTQFKNYSPETNKVEIYNKNKVKESLKVIRPDNTEIVKKLPLPNLDIQFNTPLVFSIPLPVSSVQLNKRQLLSESFKLFLPKLNSISLSYSLNSAEKDEEVMLAEANAKIKYSKTKLPVLKTAKERTKNAVVKKKEKYISTPAVKQKGNTVRKKSEISAKPYKNIISRPNDSIIISFNGLGWIYEGLEGNLAEPNGITYKGKDYSSDRTSFTFKAQKVGTYLLKFIKQDNDTAISTNKIVRLKVVKDADFSSMLMAEKNAGQPENLSKEGDYTVPDNLYKRGAFAEALREYLKIYNSNDHYLNERIALLYFKEKEYGVALKYWKRNLKSDNKYYKNALEGTILCAAKLDNIVEVSKTIENYKNTLDKSNSLREEKILFNTAQALYQNNRTKFAIELLNVYIKNYLKGRYLDAAYFYLGDIYETNRSLRDLKKSLSFFQKVYEDYTDSEYYSMAVERIDYIKRHFFDIR